MLNEIRVGPCMSADGAVNAARAAKTGELVAVDAHGRYYEACSRGNVFIGANTAVQATSTSNATATGLILTNPLGSGKMLSIIDITVGVGAAVAAAFEVGLFANINTLAAAVTQTTPITPRCALLGSANAPVGLLASAATLPATPTHIKALLASGWVTATAQSIEIMQHDIAGSIILLPNTAVSIQSVLGTQTIVASITWEEVAI